MMQNLLMRSRNWNITINNFSISRIGKLSSIALSFKRFVENVWKRGRPMMKSQSLNTGITSMMVVNGRQIPTNLTREQVDRLVLSSRRGQWYPRQHAIRRYR